MIEPCPFCGKVPDLTDEDTLYPSGTGWKYNESWGKTYHRINEVPPNQWCYVFNCVESDGGCGAEISGDSKEETIEKWNRRV